MPALLLWTKRLTIFAPQEQNPWINSFRLPWSNVSSISWNLTLLFVCLWCTWAIVLPSLSSLFFSIDTNPSTGVIYQESQWVAQEMLNRAHVSISHNDSGRKQVKQLINSFQPTFLKYCSSCETSFLKTSSPEQTGQLQYHSAAYWHCLPLIGIKVKYTHVFCLDCTLCSFVSSHGQGQWWGGFVSKSLSSEGNKKSMTHCCCLSKDIILQRPSTTYCEINFPALQLVPQGGQAATAGLQNQREGTPGKKKASVLWIDSSSTL